MKHVLSEGFVENLEFLSQGSQEKFWKQLRLLLQDIRHPSLRAKKYDESRDIWQARVDRNIRFYFRIHGETYILLDIKKHPK